MPDMDIFLLCLICIALFSVQADGQDWASADFHPQLTPVPPVKFERRQDVYFADFGRAAYGNVQITFASDLPAGQLILRLGEKATAKGVDPTPGGSISFREVSLTISPQQRIYQLDIPTLHNHTHPAVAKMPSRIGQVTPFRYVEISGCPVKLDASSIRQLCVHAPFDDTAGTFESSDTTLNEVWDLCKYTMKATSAFGIYIDGERERLAYEADAYINQLSHYACDLDPTVARRTFEHLVQYPTWPTEWSLHMPMVAHADYLATGQPVLAQKHYDWLVKKLLMDKARDDGLLVTPGIVDWPAGERDDYFGDNPKSKNARQVGPDVNTVVNAFYYHALRQMAELSRAIDKDAQGNELDARAKKVLEVFNQVCFDASKGIYIDGQGSTHSSLHANMFPLAFGMVPPERRAKVADFVASRGMACSVYGAQYLLEALFESGKADAAIKLMNSHDVRSWHHMIELGSTMTLEAWDAKYKPNLTWNHAWGAAPANILSRYVLGVRPLSPGYEKILIAPQPGNLQWVRGRVPTPRGSVLVDLQNRADATLTIQTPPGTVAKIQWPGLGVKTVRLDNQNIQNAISAGVLTIDNLSPGKHTLAWSR